MTELRDKTPSDQSLRLPGISSKAMDGMPQWVRAAFLLLSMIGIPGGLVTVREVKDWKFEERRLEIERQRNEQQTKQNIMLEDLSKTLREIKWRLPKESSGGVDR